MAENKSRTKTENGENFLAQGAILAVAAVVVKIIGVIYRVPLTNIIGDEGNGFYGYAYEVYAMTLMLSSYSIPIAVSRMVSERIALKQRKNAMRVFYCALAFAVVVGLLSFLLIFLGADFIAANLMESPLSAYALRVLAFGLFVVAILGVLRGYFQGMNNMVPTATSQILEQIFNAVISIAGASVLFQVGVVRGEKSGEELLGPAFGAAGGTLGTVAGAFIALIFLIFVFLMSRRSMQKQVRSDHTRDREGYGQILKALLLTLAPVIFSTTIYNINQILDLTIFNQIMSSQGFVEKEYMALQGIYTGKYNTLINVPLAMANGLAASVVPSLTAAYTAKDQKQIHTRIEQTIRFTMLIALPCFTGFLVLASPLMVLLYNDSSRTPALLLMIGSITVVLYCWSTVANSILQGLGKMSAPAKNAGISLVIHLISLVFMLVVLKWNIYSLVGSNIVFSLCMCILNVRKIHQVCGYRQEIDKTFIRPIIACVVMGIATYAIYLLLDLLIGGRFLATSISILAAIVIYVVCILKLGALSRDDIRAFPQGDRIYRICKKTHLLPKE